MARQILSLVLILFIVSISIALAASIAPVASPAIAASPVNNSIIGTLDGNIGGAAPVGGPVPAGVFGNLPPESQSSSASINSRLSTIATAAIFSSVMASSFLL